MKIACASDLHGQLGQKFPKADILILAGDILPNFSSDIRRDVIKQMRYLHEDITAWLRALKNIYSHIIFVAGNHDRVFAKHTDCREVIKESGVIYLENESVSIDGKLFWGSPYTPWFFGQHWVFNLPDPNVNKARARAITRACWEQIPDNTDVLITHGPPKGILDNAPVGGNVGCERLRDEVFNRVLPRLHIFGHIHEGAGIIEKHIGGLLPITFVNAAVLDGNYKSSNLIKVVEI